ncbi:hypothetical protein KNP414_02885 [Paenibacillus mucilaginosus KNP414]|uniref:Germination protein, Ger(X)C family n=2 Tax=Paenibacillus mucilaginosus TaxID=61624 RepID=F8FD27_PAEMK|nr:hypothetical protein KNP414_02885 [Paenibacillus mucilaginosus KNP414]
MMRHAILRSLPLLAGCLLLLTGCWDRKELNNVAIVMGVGIDKGQGEEYKVTAQVIKPSPPNKGGGGGSELPTWSLTAKGTTVLDAINELNRISPRRLYWPHTQLLLLGRELAESGVGGILSWFERDRDSRSGTYIAVTHGRAEDLLNQKIELGNVPSKAIVELIESAIQRQLTSRRTTLRDFISVLSTPGIDAAVDVIDSRAIRGKVETYELRGAAVFKGDRLKGFLPSEEASTIEMASGTFKDAVINIPCPQEGMSGEVSFTVTDFQRKISMTLESGRPVMGLRMIVEGNLADQSCPVQLLQEDLRSKVEAAIGQRIQQAVKTSFAKTSKWGADIFGVGQELHRTHPSVWRQQGQEWDRNLATAKLQPSVSVSIRRSGLVLEPTPAGMR